MAQSKRNRMIVIPNLRGRRKTIVKVIAFGHRSRTGKDTAAKFLVTYLKVERKCRNVVKIGFAAKLKAICHDLYAWAGLQPADFYEEPCNAHLRYAKLPYINKTPVEIWVEFGTTVGRAVYQDTWTQYLLKRVKADVLVITDLRFPNEAELVKQAGGILVKIERDEAPVLDTVADNALAGFDGWDHIVKNNGSFADLHDQIVQIAKEYGL